MRQFYCFQRFRCWGLWKKRKKRDCFTPFFQLLRGCVSILLFFLFVSPFLFQGGFGGSFPQGYKRSDEAVPSCRGLQKRVQGDGSVSLLPGEFDGFSPMPGYAAPSGCSLLCFFSILPGGFDGVLLPPPVRRDTKMPEDPENKETEKGGDCSPDENTSSPRLL